VDVKKKKKKNKKKKARDGRDGGEDKLQTEVDRNVDEKFEQLKVRQNYEEESVGFLSCQKQQDKISQYFGDKEHSFTKSLSCDEDSNGNDEMSL